MLDTIKKDLIHNDIIQYVLKLIKSEKTMPFSKNPDIENVLYSDSTYIYPKNKQIKSISIEKDYNPSDEKQFYKNYINSEKYKNIYSFTFFEKNNHFELSDIFYISKIHINNTWFELNTKLSFDKKQISIFFAILGQNDTNKTFTFDENCKMIEESKNKKIYKTENKYYNDVIDFFQILKHSNNMYINEKMLKSFLYKEKYSLTKEDKELIEMSCDIDFSNSTSIHFFAQDLSEKSYICRKKIKI